MPNEVVDLYRKYLADTGQTDDRSDYEISSQLGEWASKTNPNIFDAFPTFADEYGQIREANAPSLFLGEPGRALKSGTQGLISTGLGFGSALTGSDYLAQKAKSFEEDASANPPTIATMEEVAPGRHGIGALFSKDAARYAASKLGGAVPSLVEMGGTAAAGAALGTALEPGVGTVAGGIEGLAEGALGRGVIKTAIKKIIATAGKDEGTALAEQLAKRGITTEAGLADAVAAGDKGVADLVTQTAKQITGSHVGEATNLANVYGMTAGGIYNETGNRDVALGVGALGTIPMAIPGVSLGGQVIKRLFPDLAGDAATTAASDLIGQKAANLLHKAGVAGHAVGAGTVGVVTMEASNIVARNLNEGRDPLTISDSDVKRLKEAAMSGAIASLPLGALAFKTNKAAELAAKKELPPATVGEPSALTPSVPPEAIDTLPPSSNVIPDELAAMAGAGDAAKAAEARRLFDEYQRAIDQPKASVVDPNAAALAAGNAMVGETPEMAAQREAQKTAYSMAGGEVPNAADSAQADQRAAMEAGRAMVGADIPTPVEQPAAPGEPENPTTLLAAPASGEIQPPAPPSEAPKSAFNIPEKRAEVQSAVDTPGVKYQYTVFKPGEGIPSFTQIDVIASDGSDSLTSTNLKQLAELGINKPEVPDSLPQGKYTEEQITAAQLPPEVAFKVAAEPAPIPDAITPKAEAPAATITFAHGAVIEDAPTMDFRQTQLSESLSPEQWSQAVKANMEQGTRGSRESSKADTKIAVAMQAPDGRVVVTGVTVPDRTLDVRGSNIIKEPTLQRMGIDESGKRVIQASGNKPALLEDVVRAGFKPIAILHFAGDPGKIHQTFPDQASFDATWGASEKTTGKNIQPPELRAAIPRAAQTEAQLNRQIEQMGERIIGAKTAEERQSLIEHTREIYNKLDAITRQNQDLTGDTRPPEFRSETDSGKAIDATRTRTFQTVMGNLQNIGMKIDLFGRELLAQNSAEEIQKRMAILQQQMAATPDPLVKAELNRRLSVLQERLQSVNQAAGVAYSPWHIALAASDVGNASTGNLVTLLHEAAESLTMRLPIEQRGAVRTAIDTAMTSLRERAQAASEQTGVPLAKETSSTDLLAETLAQELTASGIPDAPSLAQAIIRWVKDAYYRTAMAVQAAFGGEANPDTALSWYENQLRREVSGDYDYSFGNIIDQFLASPLKEQARRFEGRSSTPGGITDFLDPVFGQMRQPQVETLNRDALNWNMEFRNQGDPGKELDIPDPEARARIKGGVINGLADFYEKLRQEIAPDTDWNTFFGQIKRVGEEDPKLMLGELEQKFPGTGSAKIGGERMTEPMNREAQVELWSRLRKLGLSLRRQSAQAIRSAAESTKQISDNANDINKLEGDLRNAALHEDRLKLKAKDMVRELAQAVTRGRNTAHMQGALAEAIRQTEHLSEGEAIPEEYQRVLRNVYDGSTPIFNYIKAIANLDLPLSDLTNSEVMNAISGNADHDETLAQLAANKPLAVTLAALARKNADQVDQIQLGWLRDTSRFREIHARLEEIKTATTVGLRELSKQIDERGKSSGLKARLEQSYVAKRRRQQAASDRVARSEERQALLEKTFEPVDKATADTAQAAGGAQYEWAPEEGSVWAAMRQDSEGTWRRHERVLRFKPDGSAVEGDQLRQDIAGNMAWLADRRADVGRPKYNQIAAQTYALQLLDARGQQQRTWNNGILNAVDRFVRTPVATARSLGGPAMQRVIQMLNKYQFILRNYSRTLEGPSAEWQHEFVRLRNSSGLKDNGDFINQVYKPAMYFLTVNPGLEEGPAIRQVVLLARRSLANPAADFNERFSSFLRKTKETESKLLNVAEQYGVFVSDKRLGPELRRAVPRGYLTGMRSLNGGVVDVLTKDMQRAGWKMAYDETNKDGKIVKSNLRPETFSALDPSKSTDPQQEAAVWDALGNADTLRPLLSNLFTPTIIGQWLEPFIRKPGQEPFAHDGESIPQALVQEAWNESGGDVLGWIDRLGQKVGGKMDEKGHDPVAAFRLSMLRNFDGLFGHEAKMAYEASQVPGLLDPHGAKPHVLMDARVSDLLPPEHVDFATYEPESMHRLLARVAYHGAFGRNAREMQAAFRENMNYLQGRNTEYQTLATLHTSTAGRVAEAAARGWNYDELRTANKRYQEMKDFQSQLESVLGVSANSGPLGDFSKGMALLNFVTGQIVDNPKTAAYNLISPAMRPFAQRSLGPKTISNTAKVYADILHTGLGSAFQSLGLHLFKAGRYADTIGNSEGRAFSNLPVSVILSDIGHAGDSQQGLNRWLVKPLKIARNLQRKGLQVGGGEATEFPRLAPVPGLGVINSISNIEVQASGASLAREFEQLVHDGVDYMAQHPDAANNPSFQFKPSDLYKYKLDQPLFDWWKQKSVEYNLGNLEDIVRDAAKRQSDNPQGRLLTDDQALTMSMMNQNEFSGNSSINTTPGWLMTNPFLRMAMPLLRWPLWMMSAVHEAAKPRAGENAVKPMLRAVGTLALWNLPIGIAFSMLMDQYDKKVTGHKSNLPNIDTTAALPLVGLPLTMLTSDHPLSQLESMLVRSARAGNIYGLGADVVAQTLAGLDPATGQRGVSLDQRVLVMSQLTNIAQAVLAYKNGGEATWGSVARPLFMAMGGNGVLHSVDITNHLLGLDNAQSRLVERSASSNWIRSSAQELDIPVRTGAGAGTPTPLSTQTRQMYLAALANDRADFLEAYRKALNYAREAVADDPSVAGADREKEAKQRVLASWHSRSLMSVLATKPTDAQINQLLSIMDPSGQESVRNAISRFHAFSSMIQPSPMEKYFDRQQAAQSHAYNPETMRRQMMGGGLFSVR